MKRKVFTFVMCALLALTTIVSVNYTAQAQTSTDFAKQNSKVYVNPKDGSTYCYVLKGTTSFYVYLKGSNSAYISKSGNVSGITWNGYKTVSGTKYGVYKITVKKITSAADKGTLTLANGNTRVKINFRGTLNSKY